MIRRLLDNRWLLLLCGVFELFIAVLYFAMQSTGGPLTFHAWNVAVIFLGKFTLAAGVCMIAAATWMFSKNKSWLLALNGLALSALGIIYVFLTRYRISFRVIALLIAVMAISFGAYELGRGLRHKWLHTAVAVLSFGFALAFLLLGFGGIKIEPGAHTDLLWLGFYFAFSAVCVLGLAPRPNRTPAPFDYRHA